ncbi:MAG: holo-ACP synthase [Spirochaetales bacterium]|nr:holo-ACP synthase [Spirochaetales bacterium]MBP7262793.1 holo-ACP synthase [Spirochaetia bacterium]
MIIGIGVDVVHVRRLERWLSVPGLPERFFHPDELESAKSRGHAAALSLAARFAAKEAFGKALGTGLRGIKLGDIQVLNNHNGRPGIVLYGSALERFRNVGGQSIHLSLTHERDNAIAMVVMEA